MHWLSYVLASFLVSVKHTSVLAIRGKQGLICLSATTIKNKQQARTVTKATKANNKQQRNAAMASVHCGQAALVPLPRMNGRPKGGPATVTQYGLPVTLQVERKVLKLGTAGMEVLKVSKVCYCTVLYCTVCYVRNVLYCLYCTHVWTLFSHKHTPIYIYLPQNKTKQNKTIEWQVGSPSIGLFKESSILVCHVPKNQIDS
jgi:hypothetical protein